MRLSISSCHHRLEQDEVYMRLYVTELTIENTVRLNAVYQFIVKYEYRPQMIQCNREY